MSKRDSTGTDFHITATTGGLTFDYFAGPQLEPVLCSEWEDFVISCPSVHLEQMWAWGLARQADGWRPGLLVVRRCDQIVAGALLLLRRVGKMFKIGYIVRGPLVNENGKAGTSRFLIAQLRSLCRKLHLVYLAIDLPYLCADLASELRMGGFSPHNSVLPPTGLMKGALLIDLARTEEDFQRQMRRTLKQNVRRAEKSGLVIREGDDRDIEVLWSLIKDLCRRRGTSPNISGIEIIRYLWGVLRPSGRITIHIVEIAEKPTVALMTVFLGNWVIPWRIGWTGEGRELSPEKYLYWILLKSVRERGFKVFDFNWVDPDEAEAIRAGQEFPGSVNSGITLFKLGFGGEVIRLPGAFDYFPNPLIRLMALIMGKMPTSSNHLARAASRRLSRGSVSASNGT